MAERVRLHHAAEWATQAGGRHRRHGEHGEAGDPGFAPDAGPYLPGGTLSTLAAGGNDQLAWGAAFGLVVLYGVVAATVSLAVFRSRDIVS